MLGVGAPRKHWGVDGSAVPAYDPPAVQWGRRAFGVVLPAAGRVLVLAATLGVVSSFAVPASGRSGFPGRNGLIAFDSTRGDGSSEIFTINPNGGASKELTVASSKYPDSWAPDFSPNGKLIAFFRQVIETGGPYFQVWLMNANGSGQRPVSALFPGVNAPRTDPVWAPNGRTLILSLGGSTDASSGHRCTYGVPEVFAMTLGVPGLSRLTCDFYASNTAYGGDSHPAVSASSGAIAFAGYRSDGTNIWTIPATGGTETEITKPDSPPYPSFNDVPSWSPNGKQLTYVHQVGADQFLYVVNANGTNPHQIGGGGVAGSPAAWSPDGKLIAFSDGSQIALIQPDGNGYRGLGCTPANNSISCTSYDPSWQAIPVPPRCVLRPLSARVSVTKGTLALRASCDQSVSARLAGQLRVVLPRHPIRTYKLGPLGATLHAGKPFVFTVHVPHGALTALKAGASESASFTLTGSGAGGNAHASAHVRLIAAP